MKIKINSLNDALGFMLQGLYFTETKLKEEFLLCCTQITSPKMQREVNNYASGADSKMLQLERVFNYLMKEPLSRKNQTINNLIAETHEILASTTSAHLKDILTIGCIQNINAYKISSYQSAYMFAVEMELDTASDLLQQILESEIEMRKVLSTLAIEEFNKAQVQQ